MILKIVLIVLGFGVTIFVHELGHFLMARRAGVRVEVFSIGFGPRLFTFLRRGGTDYIVSLIPIGGYVKMLGQDDLPSRKKADLTEDHYLAKTPLQRFGIISAGVVMNALLAYALMVSALWIGIEFIAPEVGKVELGMPAAAEGGFEPGDVILEMNGKPVYTFIDVQTNVALAGEEKALTFTVLRNGEKKRVVLSPVKPDPRLLPGGGPPVARIGISPPLSRVIESMPVDSEAYRRGLRPGMEVMSVVFDETGEKVTRPERMLYLFSRSPGKPVSITYRGFDGRVHTIRCRVESHPYEGFAMPPVVGVIPGGPADKAGLRTGDLVTAVNDVPVHAYHDILDVMSRYAGEGEVTVAVKRGGGSTVCRISPYYCRAEKRYLLGIYYPPRGERFKDVISTVHYVDPRWAEKIPLMPGDRIESIKLLSPEGEKRIFEVTYVRKGKRAVCRYPAAPARSGYLFTFSFKRILLRKGFFQAFGYSFVRYFEELKRIYVFLERIVTGRMSPKMIGGPIQIANVTYHVADYGMGYVFYLFSLIGLSLAVINILPVPVLDGGLLVFILYEMIRGKPASEKVQLVAQYIGLVLLAMLIIFVTYNDIMRLIR